MKLIRRLIIFILGNFCVNLVFGQLPNTGLFFYSHESNLDNRTSLLLNNNESYNLNSQEDFTLSFEMFLRNTQVKFGYIFRIISDREENVDLIVTNEEKGFLVINSQDYMLRQSVASDVWNRISVTFSRSKGQILLKFNEEEIVCPYDLSSTRELLVNFGLCDKKGFIAHDVAPFILKDVRILYNDKEMHHWPLDKHAFEQEYDLLKNRPALAGNPYWLMDNRIYWKKVSEIAADVFPQITFDSSHNRIIVLAGENLISYSLETDVVQRIKIRNNTSHVEFYNKLLYNPINDNLLYYQFSPLISNQFDPRENVRIDSFASYDESTHAHHNRFISSYDSLLYFFGGYGNYTYKSDFFCLNLTTNEYTLTDFSHTITPRYLASMGGNSAGDKLYIFGGRGAEKGRQELSPRNFADLYEFDIKNNKLHLLFDLNEDGDHEDIYSNSLVVDENSNSLYLLGFPNAKYATQVQLKRIDLKKKEMQTLANPLDFYFQDVSSFCDLYYSPKLSKLIAILAFPEDRRKANVHIYTLDFPPSSAEDVIQKEPPMNKSSVFFWILILILGLVGFVFLVRKRNRNKVVPPESQALSNSVPVELKDPVIQTYYTVNKRSILFLGGFQVFNKNGGNITGEFTPTLKYMLVLIILYTFKNDKGISSSKLQELLWFDKSEEAARNNRSVNLRKLRVLLQEVGEIDISSQNGYWMISINDNVFSDYREIQKLLNRIQKADQIDNDDLSRLLELLSFGAPLPNIQFEWVDNFKTDFSNRIIDVLLHALTDANNQQIISPNTQLRIADSILSIDPINEEAVSVKCGILYKMGKKGVAKTTFDNFTKEYKSLLGESYSGSIWNFFSND